ncbi:hypothetical protein [Peribacillus tepidiphilus]|uniref:hypothetical protein n=1 Tax=Peribacillus tepidiphilus TaxID=2652445 RepID=UPI0012927EB4|nr:hypothetical protein [Peribacillus tepidiphilus]
MVELLDLLHFKEVKEKGNGFIAITDKNLPKNCVHLTSCYEVNERYFNQKVIVSNRKNGSYYFTEDLNEVFANFNKMSKCQKCFG